jgi:hypothetical protein|tara:strand:+ start:436 stop:627 length:192 start_codon:yes stop_codon:yes gene_type:complete
MNYEYKEYGIILSLSGKHYCHSIDDAISTGFEIIHTFKAISLNSAKRKTKHILRELELYGEVI